jgi:aldehyde dehydrogenase (NAD+)
MQKYLQHYIDGRWVDSSEPKMLEVMNPATDEPIAQIALGGAKDVDLAVNAARRAFETFSRTTREQRLDLLKRIVASYQKRYDELATTISKEMGAPIWLSKAAQAATGLGHFSTAIAILEKFEFEEKRGTSLIAKEPVGVVAMITP